MDEHDSDLANLDLFNYFALTETHLPTIDPPGFFYRMPGALGYNRLISSMKRNGFLLIPFLLFFLASCATIHGSGQSTITEPYQRLTASNTLGQTFTSRHAGLNGIRLLLVPPEESTGEVILHLYSSPDSALELVSSHLPLTQIDRTTYSVFAFPTQSDSYLKDYYLELEFRGQGSLKLATGPAQAYLDGALYRNSIPQDAQLTFELQYQTTHLLWGLLRQSVTWLGWVAAAMLLFILPGWALGDKFWSGWNQLAFGVKLGLSAGLSLAIYPVLFLLTNLIHLNLGIWYAVLPVLFSFIYLVYRMFMAMRNVTREPKCKFQLSSLPPEDVLLTFLVFVILFSRLWVIRTLPLPLWGDSYQHTLITQLILNHNGLFTNWQPYAELQSLTYHFGFHTQAAVFGWLTHQPGAESVLAFGQIANVLAVLALYPLATHLTKDKRWAGVMAVLMAGLVFPMPFQYTNWGRYTQLSGQAILPVVVWFTWQTVESPRFRWRNLLPAALAWAGLALTHYRVLMLAVFFPFVLFFFSIHPYGLRKVLTRLSVVCGGGLLLALPWYIHLYGGQIAALLGKRLSTPATVASQSTSTSEIIGSLTNYLPIAAWALAAVSLFYLVVRRQRPVLLFTTWWIILFFATNPAWLRLPGTGLITNFAYFISLYIPTAILIGAAFSLRVDTQPRPYQRTLNNLLVVLLILLSLASLPARLTSLTPATSALVTRADLRAASWIRSNTPSDARFIVNNFFAYNNTSIVGSDGGWWLPYLTGRQTNVPPLTYSAEVGPFTGYQQWINHLSQVINQKGITSPAALALMRERGFTHLYIGQLQGKANSNSFVFLDLPTILASPDFKPVYNQDHVWIFEINSP